MADVLSLPIITANAASGKIKKYQMVVGGYNMMIFPIVYICFKFGLPAYMAYVVHFIVFFTNLFVRIRLMRGILNLTYKHYFQNVLLRGISVFIAGMIPPAILYYYMDDGISRLLLITVMTLTELPILIYVVGLKQAEREMIIKIVKNKFFRKDKRC